LGKRKREKLEEKIGLEKILLSEAVFFKAL
jgi:hypothetical protein